MSYFFYNQMDIRPVSHSDMDLLMSHRNDYETWGNLTSPLPVNLSGQVKWIQSLGTDKTKLYFIVSLQNVEAENVATHTDVGMIRIDEIDYINRSCRVGCDVFREHRRKHLSPDIMKLVNEFCFKELNMNRLWLLVLEGNVKAISAYKKVGFKKEGVQRKAIFRHGEYKDYLMFSLLRKEYK